MNTVNPSAASTGTANTAENKQILLKDIGAKWSKLSEQELGAQWKIEILAVSNTLLNVSVSHR